MSRPQGDATESGVLVYPRLPVPKAREGDGRSAPPAKRARAWKLTAILVAVAAIGGAAAGAVVRPMIAPDPRIGALEGQLADAGSAAATQQTRLAGLAQDLEAMTAKKRELEARLEVAAKAEAQVAATAEAAARRAKELETAKQRLAGALKGAGAVAIAGDELRITLAAGALFAKDDALSARGKRLLDRVAGAVKELTDRRVTVGGHTDDTPPPLPKAPPAPKVAAAKPARGAKATKAAPAPPAAPPAPLITNWELSADRAVAVVRYLQEAGKLDPARLSATGFGQYQPASRRDRAANRRIEIVLSPRPKA